MPIGITAMRSSKLIPGASLKVYKGAPHGICTTLKDQINDHRLERPLDPNAPQLDGTGEILVESADRAAGYRTTRADTHPRVNMRTAAVYLRAQQEDLTILDGSDNRRRVNLIADRLKHWKSIKSG